jgi:transposase
MQSYSYPLAEDGACPTLENLLLPSDLDLRLDAITLTEKVITLTVTATAEQVNCPKCAQPTAAIHSHYQRCVADLPFEGICVRLKLQVRKFFCRNPDCAHQIFAERLTPFVQAYARRTSRLRATLEPVALNLGGEGGARLASEQGMPISPDTLLRWTRQLPQRELPTPRVLGVDDWALRKGHTYGTLLVDLERHQPIELLPDREATTLAAWLEQHPGVEIIARDRAGAYAEGALRGAPSARQVADRFHLLQNLREAMQRLMDRQQKVLRQMAAPPPVESTDARSAPAATSSALPPSDPMADPVTIQAALTRLEERRLLSRSRRQARYLEVRALQQEGLGVRAIARQLQMGRHTVQRFLAADTFPERARPPRQSSILDRYVPYLTQQMQAGQTNGLHLWRDLRAQGYTGSQSLVSRWVAQHRQLSPHHKTALLQRRTRGRPPRARSSGPAEPRPRLSARRAAWLLVRDPANLDDDQRRTLARLQQLSPEAQISYPLAQAFGKMVRTRSGPALESWLQRARDSKVRELVSFAKGLERDQAAVQAGLSLPYNSGQVEGQINRLKLIKRAMYGRGQLDLLRQRVLGPRRALNFALHQKGGRAVF